jgi:hypothetical protein
MKTSPPIQFRIEWADSQGLSPLLGCRPILILVPVIEGRAEEVKHFEQTRLSRQDFVGQSAAGNLLNSYFSGT